MKVLLLLLVFIPGSAEGTADEAFLMPFVEQSLLQIIQVMGQSKQLVILNVGCKFSSSITDAAPKTAVSYAVRVDKPLFLPESYNSSYAKVHASSKTNRLLFLLTTCVIDEVFFSEYDISLRSLDRNEGPLARSFFDWS